MTLCNSLLRLFSSSYRTFNLPSEKITSPLTHPADSNTSAIYNMKLLCRMTNEISFFAKILYLPR